MSEQFSILLGNHSRLEAGQTDGAWLPMPATTEQLHDAMRNIGVTAENPQDLFVGGFANTDANDWQKKRRTLRADVQHIECGTFLMSKYMFL